MDSVRILLVEDDYDDQTIFIDVLQRVDKNADCHIARNGREALEFLRTTSSMPDFVFLDINMPIMNGFQCLAEIKQNPLLCNLNVIIYSTADDGRAKETARKLGANNYLAKPSNHKVLEIELIKLFAANN